MNIVIKDSMKRELFLPILADDCASLPTYVETNSPEYFITIDDIIPVTGFSRWVIDDYIVPSDVEYFKNMIYGDTEVSDDVLFSLKLQMTNMAFYANHTIYIPQPTPIEIGEIINIMMIQEKISVAFITRLDDMFLHAEARGNAYALDCKNSYSKFESVDTYWSIEYILPRYQEKIKKRLPHVERYLFNREVLYRDDSQCMEFIRKKDTI